MNARTVLATLVSLILVVPGSVHSQARDSMPKMVPIEFLELLWYPTMLGAGRPDLIVGQLPDRLAADLRLNEGMRVVGSVDSRVFSLAAIVMPGGSGAARDAWSAKLIDAGWSRQELPQVQAGGFEQVSQPESGASFCASDGTSLRIATRRHRSDSTAVVFVLSGEADVGLQCGLELPSSGPMRRMDSPVPTLRAPEDAEQRGSGGGGGGDEWDSHARLRTNFRPGALIGHYASQMIEQGWLPVTQSLADDVAIHVFRKTDEEGVAWHAVLYVTLLPEGERDVYLRVTAVNR